MDNLYSLLSHIFPPSIYGIGRLSHNHKTSNRRRYALILILISSIFLIFYALLNQSQSDLFFDLHQDMERLDHFVPKDYPLDVHLPTGFELDSCRSRYESTWYRRGLSKIPSPHLISKLRSYEALHKKCGPSTPSYNQALQNLRLGKLPSSDSDSDCKYIVWLPLFGLGNRMLTITSTFLYALLTDRVLLIDHKSDIPDLFCEPFPETSWLLSPDFPLSKKFKDFDHDSDETYGKRLSQNSISNTTTEPYLFIYLASDYDDSDRQFYCNQDEVHMQSTPWLIIRTDLYFVPYLFLTPYFDEELNNMFPDKEAVFHLLGRYLFHPTNQVWNAITKYYRAYLANADVKVGIQVRIFDKEQSGFKQVLDEILSCTVKERILPRIGEDERRMEELSSKERTIAVLITSLSSAYSKEVRKMYLKRSTVTGEVVSVHQPSHEEYQKTDKYGHNKKAWAEMYLLSLMDKLVTSSQSTFGYVAQGLGGVQPWILQAVENRTVPDPPCRRGVSVEPCFHSWHYYDCKRRISEADSSSVVPYVKKCEDVSWGIKLVQTSNSP